MIHTRRVYSTIQSTKYSSQQNYLFLKVISYMFRLKYTVIVRLILILIWSCKYIYTLLLLLLVVVVVVVFTAIDFSLGGSSPYTSTDTTNKYKYT